jgi:hypothetical protein
MTTKPIKLIADEFVNTASEFEIAACQAILNGYYVIILTEHTHHWVSKAIVWRTKKRKEHEGYSHAMIAHDTCQTETVKDFAYTHSQPRAIVAYQDWLLCNKPLSGYLQGDHRLKAWVIEPGPQWETLVWIARQVDRPWYQRRYDGLGIIGQAIGIPGLNVPWSDYCSEFVAAAVARHLGENPFGKHPDPNDINRCLKTLYTTTNGATVYSPRVLCRYDPTLEI